jgi:hypothetical protein
MKHKFMNYIYIKPDLISILSVSIQIYETDILE